MSEAFYEEEVENNEIGEELQQFEKEVDAAYFPEAGGVAFMTMYTPRGSTINVTARALDAKGAIDNLLEALKYGVEKYKLSATMPPLQNAPAAKGPAPVQSVQPVIAQAVHQPAVAIPPGGILNDYDVSSVFHDVDSKGGHHLKVRCGKWVKFGLYAYEQVLPKDVKDDFVSWEIKQEFAPPDSMAIAIVDETSEKPRIKGFNVKL
jgi:hypothetical protein